MNITLANGNGGEENLSLIHKIFFKNFSNEILLKEEDSAIIEKNLAFTTDSFTVTPLFFNGGDIGKLSICGTCNDLAMMGAKPKYLSSAFIIEEGLDIQILEKVAKSMKEELEINGAKIVCGDTKVVPKGSVDKLFINTTGVGELFIPNISSSNLKEGDIILVNRDIGTHGATLFIQREGIEMQSTLKSDCNSLYPIIKELKNVPIIALRDATRGGVAGVLNEWANKSNVSIEIQEEAIPVEDRVKGVCELLGLEATHLANEGTFLIAIDKKYLEETLKILEKFNKNVSQIGVVTNTHNKKVILHSSWGTRRFLEPPTGEILPRIC